MIDLLDYPALWKPNIETVESHGKTYRVFDGTYYATDTPDDVIRVLHQARKSGQRIRVHHGYTTQAAVDEAGLGGVVGRDWLEEFQVEGTVGRSMGPVKIPLLVASARSSGGHGLLTDCIVKITTAGKNRRTLYQHPDYHAPRLTLHPDAFIVVLGKGTCREYKAEVQANGATHARFESLDKAKRWLARMGLPYTEEDRVYHWQESTTGERQP